MSGSAGLESELAEELSIRNDLDAKVGDRAITLKRYNDIMAKVEPRIRKLETELKALPHDGSLGERVGRGEWLTHWESLSVPERRALITKVLRGRQLVIAPYDANLPRVNDPDRVRILSPKWRDALPVAGGSE